MELLDYAKHVARKVDEYILSKLSREPRRLYEACRHYIVAGGKRLRPLITVLSARIVGSNEDVAIPAAAAVEVLHTFTLIHDDIIDRDELRRGVPTVHKLWGVELAIVAGDTLHAYAFRMLLDEATRGVPPDRIAWAVKELAEASITVAEGQTLDMLLPSMDRIELGTYIEMVEKKTAALLRASARIGAIVGGGSEAEVEALGEALRFAGIAFQIRDDILGIVGTEQELGKPVYSDIREGKRSLPIIYALEKLGGEDREKFLRILGNREASREELEWAAKKIVEVGGIDYSIRLAEEYAQRALQQLSRITSRDSEAFELMKKLVEYIVRRRR